MGSRRVNIHFAIASEDEKETTGEDLGGYDAAWAV